MLSARWLPIPRRTYSTGSTIERAYLVAVEPRRATAFDSAAWSADRSLEELGRLVKTAGGRVVGQTIHYVGSGKLKQIIAERDRAGYNLVVFDDELSPTQQRNLENQLDVKVLDRTALILDIFAMRARTKEGRLQVELAQSEYLLPRLAGQWSHLERLGGSGAQGAIGVRGPGETQLETDRRLARTKIARLKKDIEAVRTQRSLYRRKRARSGVPVVALVGYTNAGKSTLMRALTRADVQVEDKLFATLDPVTRRLHLPSGTEALLTDTVGFIQKLPTQLVAAFQATLEELAGADLLLHTVDITHPDAALQSQTVDNTLAELGLQDKPRVTALNKVDMLIEANPDGTKTEPDDLANLDFAISLHRPDAVLVSAVESWGFDLLLARVDEELAAIRPQLSARPA
jgi:GTP-binding protein HflX